MGRCWTHVQGLDQELKLAFSRGTRNEANRPWSRTVCAVLTGGEPKPKDVSMGACAGPFSNFVSFWFPDSQE